MQLSQLPLVHATAAELAVQLDLKLPFALRLHCSVHVMQSVSGLKCLIGCCLAARECVPRLFAHVVYLTCARCKMSRFVLLFS